MPGLVMLDLLGTEPSAEEQELLLHPQCCGVILFTRNYIDPRQITALCTALHALKSPPLLIAVDHEGGPVQRFRA
ncbi:MAG: glycoside hydrolase family 3 N-terminal domain-containing protein, partial [Gammaproteobacteria bacterium]